VRLLASLAAAVLLALVLAVPARAQGINVFVGSATIPTVLGDSANLWVDTNGGTCSRTSGAGAGYSDSAACSSLDAAQDAASAGDTVRIKAGTYGAQDITGAKASTVTYIGEDKATTIFTGQVGLESKVTIEDVTVSNDSHNFEAFGLNGLTDVIVRDSDALGDYMSQYIYGVTRFSWIGGNFGDFDGSIQERHCGDPGSAEAPDGDKEPMWIGENSVGPILIEGIHFSEMNGENTPGQNGCPAGPVPAADNFHLEVWRIDDGVSDVTFRRNIIDQCPGCNTAMVFISNNGGTQPSNLKFVGNMFENGKIFKVEGAPCTDYLFAYNSFESTWSSISCSTYTNMRWVGNVVRHPGFGTPNCSQATWTENVWQNSGDPGCNTGDDSGNEWVADDGGSSCHIGNPCIDNLGFTSDLDLHLAASSPAIDSGEVADGDALCEDESVMGTLGDIDGDERGADGFCDAGADERAG
jgi:hypothetical protein